MSESTVELADKIVSEVDVGMLRDFLCFSNSDAPMLTCGLFLTRVRYARPTLLDLAENTVASFLVAYFMPLPKMDGRCSIVRFPRMICLLSSRQRYVPKAYPPLRCIAELL